MSPNYYKDVSRFSVNKLGKTINQLKTALFKKPNIHCSVKGT